MPSISGQSILVLGGSSGIGAAVAKLALEQGVHVFIASSNSTKVAKAVEALQNAAPNAKVSGFTINLDTPRIEEEVFLQYSCILRTNHGCDLQGPRQTSYS